MISAFASYIFIGVIIYSAFSFRKEIISGFKKIDLKQKIAILALLVSIFTFWRDTDSIKKSLANGEVANQLSKLLVDNSNRDLETAKKKLSFDIINTLYKDFYQFDDHNSLVIRKLKNKEVIQDDFYLGLYLNGFEDLYEQCKRGLITKVDIRMNFEHLIGTTCNNDQVLEVIGNHGNGLKLLCSSFYPGSLLAKKAIPEKDACD